MKSQEEKRKKKLKLYWPRTIKGHQFIESRRYVNPKKYKFRQTSETVDLASDYHNEANITKSKPHNFFRFPVHIKVMFTLYRNLSSMQLYYA